MFKQKTGTTKSFNLAQASAISLVITGLIISLSACNGGGSSNGSSSGGGSSSITVSMAVPAAAAPHAGVGTPIVITFTGAIQESTVESGVTFNVTSGGTQIPGTLVVESGGESAVFTPTNYLSMPETVSVSTTTGILDESGNALSAYSTIFTTQAESYEIFVATNGGHGWTGNLYESAIMAGAESTVESNGILGADYLCQQDSQCHAGWTCQAMLVESTGTIRQAAPTPVGWVLQAYTAYKNESGSPVGITGITGSNPANNYVFGFDLESAFSAVSTTPARAWTGLNSVWMTASTCAAWASSSGGTNRPGITNSSTSSAISKSPVILCQSAEALYCVQQAN